MLNFISISENCSRKSLQNYENEEINPILQIKFAKSYQVIYNQYKMKFTRTLPENNNQIFASQYQLYLPSKEELKRLIENKI